MDGDADIAAVAAAIGHPARGAMLTAMFGGRALPASDLARAARVSRSTASAHLAQLVDAGLVSVERQGRHRYHRLAGADVAEALETLAALAPPRPVRSLRESDRARAHRAARSCYDHLAGALGVAVTDALCAAGALERSSLGLRDPGPLRALGVDAEAANAGRRPLTRSCLDWSERRPHLAGALGAAVLDALLRSSWAERRPGGRALAVTPAGREALRDALDLDIAAVAPDALARASPPARRRAERAVRAA
jgi:DNA-binding transcriptional ArsR family regulator